MASKKILVDIQVRDLQSSQTIKKTAKAVDELAESTENLNNQRGKNPRAQAGLSNAILIETGRVASDANFGIMGVANNFGRLIELFQEFSRTNAGGVNEAFKRLRQSLWGVGGIIVGVQLFLSFAPRLFKMLGEWASKTTAVTRAIIEGNKAFAEQNSRLTSYIAKLSEANISDLERANLLANIKNEFKDLNIVLDENNNLTDESVVSLKAYLELQKQRAIFESTIEQITQKQTKIQELQNANVYESTDAWTKFKAGLFQIIKPLSFTSFLTNSVKNDVEELTEEIELLIKSLDVPPPPPNKSGIGKIVRQFKEGLFDISQFRLKYEKEANKIFALNEQERLDLDEQFAKKEADRKLNRFIETQKKRFEEYKEQVKGRKNANKLIADAEKELNNSIEDAKEKHGNAVLAIEDAFITKRILLADKEASLRVASERRIENTQLDSLKQRMGANEVYYNAKLAQVNSDIELDALALATTEMTLKQELKLRENLAQNQILLNQLTTDSEIAKINEQMRVNTEYVGFAQGISQILSGIAGENEAYQRAALVFQKGAAIAEVIIKATQSIATQRAATSAANMNATATYPFPFNLPIIAKNEALFLKNSALTKTGASIGVAAILATAIGGSSSIGSLSGSGDSGGGAAVQAPNFNVVGASETSQLGMALASTKGDSEIKLYWSDIDDMNKTNERNENIVGFG